MKQLVTNSQAKDFRACQRMHHIRYNLGVRPAVGDEATRFGSLWHIGQEAWWLAAKSCFTPDSQLEGALEAMRDQPGTDPFDLVKAEELLRGYHFRWQDAGLQVLEVEVEFKCDLVNPDTGASSRTFDLGGKIDAIVRDAARRVLNVEHKTSSEDIGVGTEYWRRLTLDPQISTYFVGGRALGYDIEGCLYDVVRKPGIRPNAVPLTDPDGVKIVLDAIGQRVRTKGGKKWRETGDSEKGYTLQTRPETPEEFRGRLREDIASNPDRYYQRGDVVRLQEQEQDAAFDLWSTARGIREAQVANRHPRNPDACSRYGRTCAYFDVCTGIASLDDDLRFRRIDNTHEELTQITRKQTPKEEVSTCSP